MRMERNKNNLLGITFLTFPSLKRRSDEFKFMYRTRNNKEQRITLITFHILSHDNIFTRVEYNFNIL